MSQEELEHALRDLPNTGTLIKRRPYREVWRIHIGDRAHYLKFYPRKGIRLKRLFRGDPALREFLRLQWLQKAGIPAPRATAILKGFRIGDQIGDAVILEAIEPSTPLDVLLNDAELHDQCLTDRRHIASQVIEIVRSLSRANLTHTDLHLGNFLVKEDGSVHLIDAYALRRGPVRLKDILLLAHSASRYATRTEIVRAWRSLAPPDTPLPTNNSVSQRLWKKMARRSTADNAYFSRVAASNWTGHAYQQSKFAYPWSTLSQHRFASADLESAWSRLLDQINNRQLPYLKQSDSGDVLTADLDIAGTLFPVVVKIPRRKQWHRYLTDPFRGDRALRAWTRAWELIARDIPTAWPLMVLRRTALGYPLESAIVFERVDGIPLAHVPLNDLLIPVRDTLFRRVGRLLRRLDDTGYYHRDAKSDNVMIDRANRPLLVDLDGIRSLTFGRWSLPRMLASMKLHKQYTPADSFSLCKGYAPNAPVHAEAEASP
ncbi:MAG TPA: lipopolysaccharide kinase InaA family protein [Tepidisphaeraceae bacterium]|nr:lipopolysaccharide kinase InaA family protein [Tepidisphaeraceae bacterium]